VGGGHGDHVALQAEQRREDRGVQRVLVEERQIRPLGDREQLRPTRVVDVGPGPTALGIEVAGPDLSEFGEKLVLAPTADWDSLHGHLFVEFAATDCSADPTIPQIPAEVRYALLNNPSGQPMK